MLHNLFVSPPTCQAKIIVHRNQEVGIHGLGREVGIREVVGTLQLPAVSIDSIQQQFQSNLRGPPGPP